MIGSDRGFTDRFLEQTIAMQQRPFLMQGPIKNDVGDGAAVSQSGGSSKRYLSETVLRFPTPRSAVEKDPNGERWGVENFDRGAQNGDGSA